MSNIAFVQSTWVMRPRGIEPLLPPWKGGILPLNYGRAVWEFVLSHTMAGAFIGHV